MVQLPSRIDRRSCCSLPVVSSPSDDSVTPSSRMPLLTGKSDSSSAYTISSTAACVVKRRLAGSAAGDLLEVGVLGLEGHRASPNGRPLTVPPYLFDDRLESRACLLDSEEIGTERVLRTDGLANAIGADRAFVDAARKPIVIRPRLAELLLKK